jgi:cell division protein FtsL
MSDFSVVKIGLLWLAVVASALAVTHYSHTYRQTYGQLTAMQREANQLQSAVGSLQRVEGMAADELNMRTPKASEIIMVRQ